MEEKIKRVKTPWGMRYEYKGVHIGKRYDGFSYEREIVIHETGRKHKREVKIWQLKDAPREIDRVLAEGKYQVNIFGYLAFTEEAEKEQVNGWIRARQETLASIREQIREAVAHDNYELLGRLANQAREIKTRLEGVVREEVSA